MVLALHKLGILILLHFAGARVDDPSLAGGTSYMIFDSEPCDDSLLGRPLSKNNIAVIQDAVRQFSDAVPIVIASVGKPAGCHMENFVMHAAVVAEVEGMPPVIHAALRKVEHKQCLKLVKHQRIISSTLELVCIHLEGWLPSDMQGKPSRMGHGSCFYRNAVWVKPRLLQAAVAVASEAVIWMDVDVLPFRNIGTWLTNSREAAAALEEVGFLCSAVEVFNINHPNEGIPCDVSLCNTGQLLVAAGNKSKDFFEEWARLGPEASEKERLTWSDQHALRTLKHKAWCLPKSEFGSCGQKLLTSFSVHHCVSIICPPGPFRLGADGAQYTFDDRVKIPAMVTANRWYPVSTQCKSVEQLVEDLQQGWGNSRLVHGDSTLSDLDDQRKLAKPKEDQRKLSHPKWGEKKTEELETTVLDLFRSVKEDLDFLHGKKSTAIRIKNWATGWSFERVDLELFQRLSLVYDPSCIFIIGNGFGYSTITLSTLFPLAAVDVIEAGTEGGDAVEAIELTRKVAASAGLNVSLFQGYSPQDTAQAVRRPANSKPDRSDWYELAFIDGDHENEQVVADFKGLQPWLADRFVIVFHDVTGSLLEWAIREILCIDEALRFVFYKEKKQRKSYTGVGFMYKGFSEKIFRSFRTDAGIHTCKSERIGNDLLRHHQSVDIGISQMKNEPTPSNQPSNAEKKHPSGERSNREAKADTKSKTSQRASKNEAKLEKSKADAKSKTSQSESKNDARLKKSQRGQRKAPSNRFDISSFEEEVTQYDQMLTLSEYNSQAMRVFQSGQPRKAEQLLLEALKRHGGETAERQNILVTEFNLAVVYHGQRKEKQAEVKMRHVYQEQRKHFGDHHEDTVATKGTLIAILKQMGRHEEAAFLEKPVVRRFQLEHATHEEL